MTVDPVAVIISYCSRESVYIGAILRNALAFAEVVVISMGTQLYSGETENVSAEWERSIKPHIPAEHAARVHQVVYDVPINPDSPIALHNIARQDGVTRARSVIQTPFWALFLDGDELPDGARVRSWLASIRLNPRAVYKLANYWAFLHPCLIANVHEDSIVLAHSGILTQGALSHPRERDGIYLWHWDAKNNNDVRLVRSVMGEDASPMFWHFSWVRGGMWPRALSVSTDEAWTVWIERARLGLKAKCAGWGHCGDRDWNSAIDRCMTQISQDRRWPALDFVHGHSLTYLPRLPAPLDEHFFSASKKT